MEELRYTCNLCVWFINDIFPKLYFREQEMIESFQHIHCCHSSSDLTIQCCNMKKCLSGFYFSFGDREETLVKNCVKRIIELLVHVHMYMYLLSCYYGLHVQYMSGFYLGILFGGEAISPQVNYMYSTITRVHRGGSLKFFWGSFPPAPPPPTG